MAATPTDTLQAYRDDGPVAETIGPGVAALPIAPLVGVVLGVAGLVVGVVLDGEATGLATLLGVGAFVLAMSIGVVRPPRRRLRWVVPPLLRAGEYALIVVLGWRAGGAALPVAFALQCALAFHHYDTVYRLRQQVPIAPLWLRHLGLGWEGRMIVLAVASLAGLFAPVAVVLAVWCAALFAGDSVLHWLRSAGGAVPDPAAPTEDDDD